MNRLTLTTGACVVATLALVAALTAQAQGASPGERLTVKSITHDPDGSTHVRYERTYNGLRVVGGDFVTHKSASGALKGTDWNVRQHVAVPSTTPTISAAAAKATGAKSLAANRIKVTGASRDELVVFNGPIGPRLAYDVLTEGVHADQTPSRVHTIVDAQTGAVLTSSEQIAEGSGNGIYTGSVSIGTTSGFTLKDTTGNYTTDMKNGTSGTGTTFTDADDIWGNGSNTSRQSAAVDAHYGAEKTYDYYNTQLGRAGIWGNGTGARSRVHYGNNYNNAFWDGTQMTYGDGASNAKPLTELDVAGHEMSHGVTENTANLDYGNPAAGLYKESGGLNESTSDIFGTAVEWYAGNAKDTPDYLIGEMIDLRGNGTPLRYMDKPSKDGSSLDCYSASTISVDPHYSSGPLNHWYYLLSEGSGAKTINGVSYNSTTCGGAPAVTGITHQKAEKIWYRTLSVYLTSSSGYKQARDGAIQAAIDLYGASSTECAQTQAAFNAITVPVGTKSCTGTTPPPPPASSLVNGGFESDASVDWTGSAGPITNNTGRPAHSGTWKLWLGGNGTTANEYEQQVFTVPSTATTLTYWLRVDTAETTSSTAYDKATVSINGVTKASFSNLTTPKASYVQKSIDVTAYRGQSITLKFAATEDSSLQTSFVIDDVAVS